MMRIAPSPIWRASLASLALLSPLAAQRVTNGLVVLYDFDSSSGNIVRDRSGAGQPIDLQITEPKGVLRSKGALELRGKTSVSSKKPAKRLTEAIKRSGEITLEAWIKPAHTEQAGPARLVTLSRNSGHRNVTLGQDGDHYDVRFRSTKTSTNGIPSLATKDRSLSTELTHVVYTRERSGKTRIHLNGRPAAEKDVPGDTSNWDSSSLLVLGNEVEGIRPWKGTLYLVAIYSRDLSSAEVAANFKAGAGAASGLVAREEPDPKVVHFETRIAPILANHCVECHDASTHKGKLDLTRKATAFAALENGTPIVPGNLDQSLLWDVVFNDEMPEDNDPLGMQQKADLKKWIEDGAIWSLEEIDPANYVHSGGGSDQRWVQRHTVEEYIATVKATVGVDIAAEARQILPPDLRADGFTNTAYNLSVDLKHIDAYARLAEIIVSRMDPEIFARQFARNHRFTDKDMEALLKPMGTWILRGPLEAREIIAYRGISTSVASVSGSFKEAVGYMIQAMLQSPRFIYRIENQRGDGSSWPIDSYELATRMSYIIWGASPDKELMRAAREGNLSNLAQIELQAARMLKDPRTIERSVGFITQWLNLGRLPNMRPSPERFPNWKAQIAEDMRTETVSYFKEVVWTQERPLGDLLNAQVTFLTPRLANHYRGRPPQRTQGGPQRAERHDLTTNPARGGLLTHGSVLTMGGDDASMVTRGLFVMHNLLRGVVKDPPAGVDTTPVPPRPGLSHRGAAQKRIADRSCGGCHIKFEPLAFGLEKYDGLGTYFEKDHHGNTLREDGEILFPGEANPTPFQNTGELMDLLAKSKRVHESLTWKVIQFSIGRPLGSTDAPAVLKIHKAARKNGGTWPALIKALVTSDLVRMTPTESTKQQLRPSLPLNP
ncbi:MAG: DUF1592 domain-containing protein [Roseibacillus sp.]|nr:DUF1592 domain-containing protein [Roseibacillus sp.]